MVGGTSRIFIIHFCNDFFVHCLAKKNSGILHHFCAFGIFVACFHRHVYGFTPLRRCFVSSFYRLRNGNPYAHYSNGVCGGKCVFLGTSLCSFLPWLFYSLSICYNYLVPRSSSGLGHRLFRARIVGSNPTRGTLRQAQCKHKL